VGDERTVLVLTHWFDPTADYVIEELHRREVPVVRCNPGDFPGQLALVAALGNAWTGVIRTPDRVVQLTEIGCVYYRRPTAFELPAGMSEPEQKWAAREARLGLGGVLATLPRWLNHPADIARAEYKPMQLAAARAAGLRVPDTLITNDVAAARGFVEAAGRAVYKPLAGSGIAEDGTYRLIYATQVAAEEIDESVTRTAHLFQAWVQKDYEVRVTIVNEELHAARIDAGSEAAAVDWRRDYDHLTYSVVEVPADVRRGTLALMRTLRLRFGALDFVVTPGGEWVFLEINPNGQWAWIEEQTGLPIAASIADALTKE
jgi:ATP-grasp ribosomal peptide maturase